MHSYLVTLALIGSGTPGEIAANTANWVTFQGGQVWNEIHYSTSYAPLLQVRNAQIPVLDFVPSRTVETIERIVPALIRASQGVAVLALAAAWLQPRALPPHRIATILLGVFLVTQSPGGYTQTFLLFLVLLEPWRGAGQITAIVCAYLLCLRRGLAAVDGARPVARKLARWPSGQPELRPRHRAFRPARPGRADPRGRSRSTA